MKIIPVQGISALALLLCLFVAGCGPTRITGIERAVVVPRTTGVGAQVVSTAQTQLGKFYRYGGASPQTGFDCSGLIWWAYRQHGIKIPRVARDQAGAGSSVSRSGLRPGDILVFKTPNLHTALYAGRGKFIHSPSSGKRVRHDEMKNPYWSKRLVRIRRVVR